MGENGQGNSRSLQTFVKRTDVRLILSLFFSWRLLLFLVLFFAVRFVPLQSDFLGGGGGVINYLTNPYLFAWANFDGEHHLFIAKFGYKILTQAFFPLYAFLIKFLAHPFSLNFATLTSAGFLISNISFLISLFLMWKLIILDYSRKIAVFSIILLLSFPTSFYFGSVYSESLYLVLSVGAFYAARRQRWFLVGMLGLLASLTRVFGILLLPVLFIEAWQAKAPLKKYFWIFLIPLGLFGYMFFQWKAFNDPLAFYNLQTLVGYQHQRGIVLLPQVFFRYFKILLSLDLTKISSLSILLEFFSGA